MLIKLDELTKNVLAHYEHFRFDAVYRDVTNFVTRELSAFYLDWAKDVLYIDQKDANNRRSIQTVLYQVTSNLLKLLTPILTHTTSEAYETLKEKQEDNVYLENMPDVKHYQVEGLKEKYQAFMELRNDVLKALEEARNEKIIGKSLNAKLTLYPNEKTSKLLSSINHDLAQLFIVSECVVKSGEGTYKFDDLSIDVEKREGHTFALCWQVVDEVNSDELCERCETVVESL